MVRDIAHSMILVATHLGPSWPFGLCNLIKLGHFSLSHQPRADSIWEDACQHGLPQVERLYLIQLKVPERGKGIPCF